MREFVRALGCKDVSAPGAMTRYAEFNAEFDQMLVVARKAATRQFDTLDTTAIGCLTDRYQMDALNSDGPLEARYTTPGGQLDTEAYRDDLQMTIEAHHDALGERNYVAIRKVFGDQVERLAAQEGYRLAPDGASMKALCDAFVLADIAVCEARIVRSRGFEPEQPVQSIRPLAREADTKDGDVGFVTFGLDLLTRPALGKGASTQQATRTSLRFFKELHGDMLPRQIRPEQVRQYRDALRKRPTRLTRASDRLALPDLIRQHEGKTCPRQSAKTVNGHICALSALWNSAANDEHERPYDTLVNPFLSIRDKSNRGLRAGDAPAYSTDELNALFRLPVFTDGERPTRGKGEAAYWLPLLLLWTGGRPNEIAQLNVADIFQDPTGWRIRITDEGDHETKGHQALKTSRIGSGCREFPLPKWLVDNGLPRYAQWVAAQGHTALFPRLRPKGERNDLYATFGDWWCGYVRQHGLLQERGRKPGREFRHCWTTAARQSDLSEEAREYIQGHTSQQTKMNRRYGSQNSIGEAIASFRYQGLNLDHLLEWRSPSV